MGTDTKKDSFIKIRVSQEQKELYKKFAEAKGITVTELLVVGTEQLIEKDRLKHKEAELIEPRIKRIEKELMEVKKKMDHRKQTREKSFKWFK